MSNAAPESRNPGQRRRRRNRGGKNRNAQQGNNSNSRPQDSQHSNGQGRQGGQQFGRVSRERRPTPPVKLSLWQKFLKLIGLYKEPVRPPRPGKPERTQERSPKDPQNANREPREPREPRGERGERPAKANIRIARSDSPRRNDANRGPVESSRLYVGNLSYDVTEGDLADLFKGIGGVRNVEVVYNRSTHRSKGYAFVEMVHVDDAKRAVEVLHDQPFMGRKMNVSGAKSKGSDEREDQEYREERNAKPVSVPEVPPVVEIVTPLIAEAAPVVAEAAPVVAEAAPVVAEAAPVVAEAAPVVAEAAPVVAEAAPVVAEAAPVVAEASPVVAEAAPATEGEEKPTAAV